MAKGNILNKLFAAGPLFLLYYLSISEVDTNLEKLFEVFSLNLQIAEYNCIQIPCQESC